MPFKLGGVRLRSSRGLPDLEQARALRPFWGYLPLRLIGGNARDRNATEAVLTAADVVGREPWQGWRMLANLVRLGAFEKVSRFEWRKCGWPRAATRASFERMHSGRPERPRCPTCGQKVPRGIRVRHERPAQRHIRRLW